jgi:BMFP domain-containing protein YqiC
MLEALLVSMLVFALLYTLLVAARMRLAALDDRLAALEDAAWRSQ